MSIAPCGWPPLSKVPKAPPPPPSPPGRESDPCQTSDSTKNQILDPALMQGFLNHIVKDKPGALSKHSFGFFKIIASCLEKQDGVSKEMKDAICNSLSLNVDDNLGQSVLDKFKDPNLKFLVLPILGTHDHAMYVLARPCPHDLNSLRLTICNRGSRDTKRTPYETWDVKKENLTGLIKNWVLLKMINPDEMLGLMKSRMKKEKIPSDFKQFLDRIVTHKVQELTSFREDLKKYFEQTDSVKKPDLSQVSIAPELMYSDADKVGTYVKLSHQGLSQDQKGGYCVLDNLWAALKLAFVESDRENGLMQFKACKAAVRKHLSEVGTPEQKNKIEEFERKKEIRTRFQEMLNGFEKSPSVLLEGAAHIPDRFPGPDLLGENNITKNLELLTQDLLKIVKDDSPVNARRNIQNFINVLSDKSTEPFLTFEKILTNVRSQVLQSNLPVLKNEQSGCDTGNGLMDLSTGYKKLVEDLETLSKMDSSKLKGKLKTTFNQQRDLKCSELNDKITEKKCEICKALEAMYCI